jgi:uncharacterized protein YcfL
MKNIVFALFVVSLFLIACGTQQKTVASKGEIQKEEPVRIANDSLEYEIVIFDIGFSNYLNTIAMPMNYYSEDFLESRNRFYVTEWNNRARNTSQFDGAIYENIIDYQSNVNYGLEVNYKLFWYFQFAQNKYKMRLSGFRVYGVGGAVTPYRNN